MSNLCTYILTTKGEQTELKLELYESFDKSYTDQGIEVNCIELMFYFSNGVVLKYVNESGSIEEHEQLCAECWISYEVVFEPAGICISPIKKSFINQCQEAFWLKMNKL